MVTGFQLDFVLEVYRHCSDARQRHLASLLSPAAWGDIWERIGQIHAETERANLDNRQAVVTALALLGQPHLGLTPILGYP